MVVEHLAEDALCEQVLDKHLLHRLSGDVGVDGLAAEAGEAIEGLNETLVADAFLLDELKQSFSQFWDSYLEFLDSLLKLLVGWGLVGKEYAQTFYETSRLGDVFIEDLSGILPDDDALRSLEEDIVLGVSGGELLLDFLLQVVAGVLRLPLAMRKLEIIHQSAINADGVAIAFE